MAIEVPLSKGKVAVIDELDAPWVMERKWFARPVRGGYWYAVTNDGGGRKRLVMHREILGAKQHEIVDHVNGDTLDNRRSNLRLCNRSENMANRAKRVGRSRFKGVVYRADRNRWYAQIGHNGRRRFLGSFETEESAAIAYDAAARSLFGSFARLNLPREVGAPAVPGAP